MVTKMASSQFYYNYLECLMPMRVIFMSQVMAVIGQIVGNAKKSYWSTVFMYVRPGAFLNDCIYLIVVLPT